MKSTKTITINVRCTPKIKEEISQKAKKAEMSISEFVLTSCNRAVVYVLEGGKDVAKELYELRVQIHEKGYEVVLDKKIDSIMLKLDSILDKIETGYIEAMELSSDTTVSEDDDIEVDEEWWEENFV